MYQESMDLIKLDSQGEWFNTYSVIRSSVCDV